MQERRVLEAIHVVKVLHWYGVLGVEGERGVWHGSVCAFEREFSEDALF